MITIERRDRYFAILEGSELLTLVVNREGAERVKARLEELLLAIMERDRYIRNSDRRATKRRKRPPSST